MTLEEILLDARDHTLQDDSITREYAMRYIRLAWDTQQAEIDRITAERDEAVKEVDRLAGEIDTAILLIDAKGGLCELPGCTNPKAYPGARFCGAACSATFEAK